MAVKRLNRWGLLWRSENKTDGKNRHLIFDAGSPLLFRTRREARGWAEYQYGHIRTRPDLRAEPHGWKMPLPVKVYVKIVYTDCNNMVVTGRN